jgi:lipoprotein-anchoring transpeptidase ErfK/SrfK
VPRRALLVLLALVAAAATACTGERPSLAESVTTTAPTTTAVDEHPPSLVAEASGESVGIYPTEAAAAPMTTLVVADQVGKHLVFLVVDDNDDWLQVLLPVQPNGTTGWVRRADVRLTRHDFRIEVERGDHRIRVYRGDTILLDEPVGIGTVDTPPAGERFFVTELLESPDPAGPYGPFAYGLSGFANELTDFAGGGVIGIHGTNDPAAIGADVGHGCISVSNDAIDRLVKEIGLPLGTPVEILA